MKFLKETFNLVIRASKIPIFSKDQIRIGINTKMRVSLSQNVVAI